VVTLLLFIGALAKTLSLLKVGILGCMAMNTALPNRTALGELSFACLSLGFLSGVGPLEKAGCQMWSPDGLVNEQSPALSTYRASLS
jgi:hypothetical protein